MCRWIFLGLLITTISSIAGAKNEQKHAGIYNIQARTLGNKPVAFKSFKGKVLLIVNTASKCGYTPQFSALQSLHKTYATKNFAVIGIPSNDFKQELTDADDIAKHCKLNFGVDFTMLAKTSVRGKERHPLYAYLVANSSSPGEEVAWNFEKFVVGKDGKVLGRFKSKVKPDDPKIIALIEKSLK